MPRSTWLDRASKRSREASAPLEIHCGGTTQHSSLERNRHMARKKIRLTVIQNPDANAGQLIATTSPMATGDEGVDLLCGQCDSRITRGVSAETLKQRFASPAQLLVVCSKCGAHNRFPAKVGN